MKPRTILTIGVAALVGMFLIMFSFWHDWHAAKVRAEEAAQAERDAMVAEWKHEEELKEKERAARAIHEKEAAEQEKKNRLRNLVMDGLLVENVVDGGDGRKFKRISNGGGWTLQEIEQPKPIIPDNRVSEDWIKDHSVAAAPLVEPKQFSDPVPTEAPVAPPAPPQTSTATASAIETNPNTPGSDDFNKWELAHGFVLWKGDWMTPESREKKRAALEPVKSTTTKPAPTPNPRARKRGQL